MITPSLDRIPLRHARNRAMLLLLLTVLCGGCGVIRPRARRPGEEAPDLFDLSTVSPKLTIPTGAPSPRAVIDGAKGGDKAVAKTSSDGTVADPTTPLPPSIPGATEPFAIDLSSSLRLADGQNPELAEARVEILGALARQQQARVLLIPTLNAGMNYHGHDGNLQRSSGRILKLSEQSFYISGGARTLAAESVAVPAVNISTPLTDAVFEPLAARQRVNGARLNASATANVVLLEVGKLFLELWGAEASLEAQRRSTLQAGQIVKAVDDYAATGQGRRSDANRAQTELGIFRGELQHFEETVAVSSARLSKRLNLDPSVRLRTITGPLEPLTLIDPEQDVESLIGAAINQRPDLAARSALISEAEFRLREEKARPFLPTLWLGFSGGSFGGGSNLVPPLLSHFGGRTDFDVRATWTLLNFGVGNAALIKRRGAEVGEAVAERSRVLNKLRSEVTSARAEAIVQRRNVEIARAELASAEAGFREDFERLRETVGLPIEVLDSLKLLARARINFVEAVTKSNQAQFSLYVSLGTPPPIDPSSPDVTSSAPIATPLPSPIVSPRPEASPVIAPAAPPMLGR